MSHFEVILKSFDSLMEEKFNLKIVGGRGDDVAVSRRYITPPVGWHTSQLIHPAIARPCYERCQKKYNVHSLLTFKKKVTS